MPAQSSTIDLVEIIKQDYQNFPNEQTYSIYAENVYFEDPLNKLQGIARYQKMISFLNRIYFENRSFSSSGSMCFLTHKRSLTARGVVLIRC
ncbi:MAG: DUF2358 domain-containing protein [Xenococcus sp. MO_188.B8]|nr:DUF2358 domain-containing protein [Xenococcus sp. MO_188.B8]